MPLFLVFYYDYYLKIFLSETCSGELETNCDSCNSDTNHRTADGTKCICEAGYYDDSTNALCATCDKRCKTCNGGT